MSYASELYHKITHMVFPGMQRLGIDHMGPQEVLNEVARRLDGPPGSENSKDRRPISLDGDVTSGFGERKDPKHSDPKHSDRHEDHPGIDIAHEKGDSIGA